MGRWLRHSGLRGREAGVKTFDESSSRLLLLVVCVRGARSSPSSPAHTTIIIHHQTNNAFDKGICIPTTSPLPCTDTSWDPKKTAPEQERRKTATRDGSGPLCHSNSIVMGMVGFSSRSRRCVSAVAGVGRSQDYLPLMNMPHPSSPLSLVLPPNGHGHGQGHGHARHGFGMK